MDDLATPQLAFRVALIAAALWLVSTLAEPLHWWIGVAVLAGMAWLLLTAFRKKSSKSALYAAILAAGGGLLISGVAPMMQVPLFALAAISGALGLIAMLGSNERQAANDD